MRTYELLAGTAGGAAFLVLVSCSAHKAEPVEVTAEPAASEATVEEVDRPVKYEERREIDFEGVGVQGEVGRPQGSVTTGGGGLGTKGMGRGGGGTAQGVGSVTISGYGYGSGAVDAPAADNFRNYGVNGVEDAARDWLSTFAVDVDTGSYTVSRRRLESGTLPPQAAVRVEEFV